MLRYGIPDPIDFFLLTKGHASSVIERHQVISYDHCMIIAGHASSVIST